MTQPEPSHFMGISGFTAGGDYVKTVHLEGRDGMRASILTLGARLLDLRLSDGRPLTLSFSTLPEVEADTAYVCVAVGRTANRIRGGLLSRLQNSEREVTLECNENGRNHIHGGRRAWDKRLFAVRSSTPSAVELYLFSPDGDQGYPSSVEVVVRYELTGTGELAITLTTTNVGTEQTVTNMTVCFHNNNRESRSTLCRKLIVTARLTLFIFLLQIHIVLCNVVFAASSTKVHPYFDLSGRSGQARDSVLNYQVVAPSCEHYLVLDDDNVPTGDIAPVEGTCFDFRRKRPVAEGASDFEGYDQYFVASNETSLDGPTRSLVTITAPTSDHGPAVEMEVLSNQPGFQMYTANGFKGTGAGSFEKFGSIAVEPSGYIDAGNHDAFPTIVLEPKETRRQLITYRFKILSE